MKTAWRYTIVARAIWGGQAACAYCGLVAPTEIDHVIPVSRGGSNSEGNLVPVCEACNWSKFDLLLVEWRRRPYHWREPQRAVGSTLP